MAIPHRGWTSNSTYFITASTASNRSLFQSTRMADLFVDVLYHYRNERKYWLHAFVVMPTHFHLLLTPAETLERALQLIKGGFSYRARHELDFRGEIWETSFYDRRVRNLIECQRIRDYIHSNPVRRHLVQLAGEYPYSSANQKWVLDEVPQRLKPSLVTA